MPAHKTSKSPPTDSLKLPLPPVVLHFAVRGDGGKGVYQRYVRKGDQEDATSAVIGKGGFGTAYRYVRDDSFTPPTSVVEASLNSTDCDASRGSEPETRGEVFDLTQTSSQLNPRNGNGRSGSMPPSPGLSAAPRSQQRTRAPAVVVIKVCRTPTSGSYDELPKTGIGRTEAKIAAQEIAAGNPIGEHTRIVRGEARLMRYLQMCQVLENIRSHRSHCVRLLADIPIPGLAENGDEGNGPPIPRLLVFERLVDLDAELTPRGWSKSKQVWTVDKVESTAKDAVAGLAFLHRHNIVHGDLKPSNFMRDARTGAVKLIDLGASRRWVRLHNLAKERTTAVEELDRAVQNGHVDLQRPDEILCEGLGSLTGSPHFMSPEVLLQAGRYLSAEGVARNVLDDYVANRSRLPRHPSTALLGAAHRDFKRGWGIKADIWSWGCSVLSLLLRTCEPNQRPSSSTVCAFDFSFENEEDALPPIWPLHPSNDSLPRFHQWARLYALRIMSVVERGVVLPEYASALSVPFINMLNASFYHVDTRPSASMVLEYLESQSHANMEYMNELGLEIPSRAPSRAQSVAQSVASASSFGLSLPDEPHNVDVTPSSSFVTSRSSVNHSIRLNASEQNLILPTSLPPVRTTAATAALDQSSSVIRQTSNRMASSPAASPSTHTSALGQAGEGNRRTRQSRPASLRTDIRNTPHSRPSSLASEVVFGSQGGREERQPISPRHLTASASPLRDFVSLSPQSPRKVEENGMDVERLQEYNPPPVEYDQPHLSRKGSMSSVQSMQNWPVPEVQRKHTLRSKVSRSSIFSRMANSLTPHLRPSTADDMRPTVQSGERTARPPHLDHAAAANDGAASMAPHTLPTSPTRLPLNSPSDPMLDSTMASVEHAESRKSGVLGLDLGLSLRSSMRTVRSLASLNSSFHQQGKGRDAAMPNSPRVMHDRTNTGDEERETIEDGRASDAAATIRQHQRMHSVPQSLIVRMAEPQRQQPGGVLSGDEVAVLPSARSPGSFLDHDPFGIDAKTPRGHQGAAPQSAPLHGAVGNRVEEGRRGRQRAWSGFFRRKK